MRLSALRPGLLVYTCRAVTQSAFSVSHSVLELGKVQADRGQLTPAGPQGASPRPQETEHGPATGVHTCAAPAPSPALPNGDAVPSPAGRGSSCGDKGQATSGCSGLSTSRPWSARPLNPPIPISSGEQWPPAARGLPLPAAPPGEAGFRADALTAWPPWPLRRCEGSLWGGAERGVELDLQAHLALQLPSLSGTGLASPSAWKPRHPASSLKPPDARQEGSSVSLHSREPGTFQLQTFRGPSARSPVGGGFPGAP